MNAQAAFSLVAVFYAVAKIRHAPPSVERT